MDYIINMAGQTTAGGRAGTVDGELCGTNAGVTAPCQVPSQEQDSRKHVLKCLIKQDLGNHTATTAPLPFPSSRRDSRLETGQGTHASCGAWTGWGHSHGAHARWSRSKSGAFKKLQHGPPPPPGKGLLWNISKCSQSIWCLLDSAFAKMHPSRPRPIPRRGSEDWHSKPLPCSSSMHHHSLATAGSPLCKKLTSAHLLAFPLPHGKHIRIYWTSIRGAPGSFQAGMGYFE